MTILVLSQRATVGGLASQLAYSAWHEAEDVLVNCHGAQLGLLNHHGKSGRVRVRRIVGRGVRRVFGRSTLLPAFSAGVSPRIESADHLIFMAHGAWDLPLLERLKDLRRTARTISVWMPEVWPSELDRRVHFESYAMVDNVFVGIPEVLSDFATIAPNSNVVCLPPAADVVSFGGPSMESMRQIAVLGLGRREPSQHARIRQWAEANRALYLYDTVKGQAIDWREHRDAVANMYRHSRIALCNYGKHDEPDLIGSLRVVPGRLYEGLAAGAVLIGMPPDESSQKELVGEVVVESTETNEIEALLDLFNDRSIGHEVGIRNSALACRRHDWAHRWTVVLDAIEQPVPDAMQARLVQLDARATALEALR